MQPFLSVNVDTRELDAALAALGRPQLDVAVAKALADTAKNAMVKAVSLIARRTGLRSATVRPKIMTDYVRVGDYATHIRSSRRPIPLIDFPGTRQTATGVATRAWGKPQVLRSAFIATMPTGHRGVFRRSRRTRLPIRELWGPHIHGTFATPEIAVLLRDVISGRLNVNLRRRIRAEQRGRRQR